jgi:hypothetical protein
MDVGTMMVVAVVVVIAVGLAVVYPKMARAQLGLAEGMVAQYRAGLVAQRLGMQITVGDPATNLVYDPSTQTAAFTGTMMAGGQAGASKSVTMTGAPFGHPTEILLHDELSIAAGSHEQTYRRHFHGMITVRSTAAVPTFELACQPLASYGGVAPQPRFPAGVVPDAPSPEPRFTLRAADPRVGSLLAAVLPRLAAVHYVHIVGEGNAITFLMTPSMGPNKEHFFTATNAARSAFASTEAIVDALDALACAFEGRPMPPPRAPAPHATA